MLKADVPSGLTDGDLCFQFAQHGYEPLWGIDYVQLVPTN